MDHPLSSLSAALTLPGHRAAAQHWLALYRAAGNRVPPLSSLDPLRFSAALPDIWIVDLAADGRFRFHLLGVTVFKSRQGHGSGVSSSEIRRDDWYPVAQAEIAATDPDPVPA